RDECAYDGPGIYWHWATDIDSGLPMNEWSVFDPAAGFGGDGVPGTYTLPPDPDNVGATASPSPEMLPPNLVYKGCVQDGPFANLTLHLGPGRLVTTRCLVRWFHSLWRRQLDGTAVGKVLASTSFEEFRVAIDQGKSELHGGGHPIIGGEIDRMWWLWQQADPERRLYEVSGPSSTNPNVADQTTLDNELRYPGSGDSRKIRDIIDTSLEPSCFTYDPL
ncbi:Di-copper centre-containing protein, partial [Coprinellus micaceus]